MFTFGVTNMSNKYGLNNTIFHTLRIEMSLFKLVGVLKLLTRIIQKKNSSGHQKVIAGQCSVNETISKVLVVN